VRIPSPPLSFFEDISRSIDAPKGVAFSGVSSSPTPQSIGKSAVIDLVAGAPQRSDRNNPLLRSAYTFDTLAVSGSRTACIEWYMSGFP